MTDEEFQVGDRVRFWTYQDCIAFYRKNNPGVAEDTLKSLEQSQLHWGAECTVYGQVNDDIILQFSDGKRLSVNPRSIRHTKPLEELISEVLGEDYL